MLIVGIDGLRLAARERKWLGNTAVSGVILFSRNFEDREQLGELIEEIRGARREPLLLCVDQEGGRVQRFQQGFTRLPALAKLGQLAERDPKSAERLSEMHAWVMAAELRAVGIDLSFAPVLDLQKGNRAILDRAFSESPEIVSLLGSAYIRGMRLAGMAATIKHFPGHGSVLEDTHDQHATDPRGWDEMAGSDLLPFKDAIAMHAEAVMMAHVSYPAVDAHAAGYSARWIKEILRQELGFRGVVFSDDIGMVAADSAGNVAQRIHAHLDAGCDFVLACHPDLVEQSLKSVAGRAPAAEALVASLSGKVAPAWRALADNPQWHAFKEQLRQLEEGSV